MKRVGAAEKTVAILTLLADGGRPRRLAEITTALRINPSTGFNILRTLAALGWVTHDRDTRCYGVGPRLVGLGRPPEGEIGALLERLADLAAQFHANMALWRRDGRDHLVLAAAFEGPGETRVALTVGQRRPLLLGAMGRVIAAFGGLERAEMEAMYAATRWHRPIAFSDFMKEAALCRRRGWAEDEGGAMVGLHTLAAPVFDAAGAVSHVCCSTMFVGQHTHNRRIAIAERLRQLGRVSP